VKRSPASLGMIINGMVHNLHHMVSGLTYEEVAIALLLSVTYPVNQAYSASILLRLVGGKVMAGSTIDAMAMYGER